jgi:Uncharacterised methyltransferase family (DUF6094)
MARLESVAVGGYFPTPESLLPAIAGLLTAPKKEARISFLDPCAGEGTAVVTIAKALRPIEPEVQRHTFYGGRSTNDDVWSVEMEESRHKALQDNVQNITYGCRGQALHGDAFQVTWEKGKHAGATVLYLNPPYDLDPVHRRLEERFLDRFTPALARGGVLLFVVPGYALSASAETLARRYTGVKAYRFPEPEWGAFKQVVLVARRGDDLMAPDKAIVALVESWAENPLSLPVLGGPCEPTAIPDLSQGHGWGPGFDEWKVRSLDLAGLLLKATPWQTKDRTGKVLPVQGVLPAGKAQDLLLRVYPAAMPPRPAHLAAGIAAGIFNGARVDPDAPGLPPLLVKGVFDREYRTIEEKKNKEGDVTGFVQIQQPKLVVTALDLTTSRYHTLQTLEGEGATIETLTIAGLLKNYGTSLMGVLAKQCPVLYDPRRDAESIPLPVVRRTPFTAQAHAARGIVRLLGGLPGKGPRGRMGRKPVDRKNKSAILLGEIGSGKSTVSLLAAKTIEARKVLVVCPPHLLTSWTNEVASTLGDEASVQVLKVPEDVDAFAAANVPRGHMLVGVLSREAAKLGHGWVGVTGACPKCGSGLPEKVDLAKKRATCEAKTITPTTPLAELTLELAYALQACAPEDTTVEALLTGRHDAVRAKAYKAKKRGALTGLPSTWLDRATEALYRLYQKAEDTELRGRVAAAFGKLFFAFPGDDRIVNVVRRLAANERVETYNGARDFARALLWLASPEVARAEVQAFPAGERGWGDPTASFLEKLGRFEADGAMHLQSWFGFDVTRREGKLFAEKIEAGSVEAVSLCLQGLGTLRGFQLGPVCGERLFQAVPDPRRVALAKYLCRKHPDCFDLLILDEGHEYATEGSAQEKSAHRLTSIGKPTILLSGSIMNGYAESLFTNLWALSAQFREEFARSEKGRFVDRYGYRKRLVTLQDEKGTPVSFGAVTDRTEEKAKVTGDAPGVLPLLVLQYLLLISITLHKSDLAIDLPPCDQERIEVTPDDEVLKHYKDLESSLIQAIRRDMFKKDRAGKLWGQLAELPSYPDRAHAGYTIAYPDGEHVATAPKLENQGPLAKERWMLDEIEREIAEGRNVLVFAWHTELLPRLARLISERIGEPVPVLHADKVPTSKRQDWIDREVVTKGRKVLVANPVTVQTGLNNLVHFATEIWMENAACNPTTYRQAIGRVDRIGQKKPTRILFPVYDQTLQTKLYDLLLRKVAVSISTDGLDPESALRAAGAIQDDFLAGLSLGKQIFAMFGE